MKKFKKYFEVDSKTNLLIQIASVVTEDSKEQDIIYNDLIKREKEYSTGLENGFAISHCRTNVVSEPNIIIGKLKTPINDYKTLDQKPVEIIISFIVPDNVTGEETHLKLLSQIMRKLVNTEVQTNIKKRKKMEEKHERKNSKKRR